jgi:hypothetical protein
MDESATIALFQELYSDITSAEQFNVKQPLLAHYTSISTLESILRNEEIWLSNPLFMNDMKEVRFGLTHAIA